MGMKIKQKVTKPRHPKMVSHGDALDYSNIYSGSKKCPNVCMIWKNQMGVIC
jgi:hypothetical protein